MLRKRTGIEVSQRCIKNWQANNSRQNLQEMKIFILR